MRGTRILWLALVSASIVLWHATVPVLAADGRLEISQACAEVGCFAGDTPGFPVQITSSGSYVLTSNLSPPAGTGALLIGSSNVVLDLNSFMVLGGGGVADGIEAGGMHVEIRNGTVQAFGGRGIANSGFGGSHLRIIEVEVMSNTGGGVSAGNRLLFQDSLAIGNGSDGVIAGSHSTLLRSRALDNGANGFVVGPDSYVAGCSAIGNGTALDHDGIEAGAHTLLRENLYTLNAGYGLSCFDVVCSLIGNVGRGNTAGASIVGMGSLAVDNLHLP